MNECTRRDRLIKHNVDLTISIRETSVFSIVLVNVRKNYENLGKKIVIHNMLYKVM